MKITNPYTFNINEQSLLLKINTLPVPSGELYWPISTDAYGRSLLAVSYTFTVPDGITALQVYMGTNINGQYVSNVRIQNIDSRKYWFDNINTDAIVYPVIGVSAGKTYNLTIGGTAPIEDNGTLKFIYSNDINKSSRTIMDE